MIQYVRSLLLVSPVVLSLLFGACTSVRGTVTESVEDPAPADTLRRVEIVMGGDAEALIATIPPLKREFRGAWVATVDNIDWPSQPGLTTGQQQAEMIAILDRVNELNLNAIVFQVRPTADAFYSSEHEPWSAYLTGVQGQAPDPYYDPLAFTIEEAHRRGIEVHAWVNPFRAYHPTADAAFDDSHVSFRKYTIEYGTQRWMDPGNPEAREHSLRVIFDIVDRYEVDGIHMDDYFYPYPVQDGDGNNVPFPDGRSWQAYRSTNGDISREDWRRQNVDDFIERVYLGIKERKPWVKFGISPFGIWRPGYPDGIVGFDAYEGLYADARKWLVEGWVDYFSPQLYWAMESEGQPYPKLLDWWIQQNQYDRHLWPGNFTSRIRLEGSRYWGAEELLRQIEHTQATPGAEGNIHFSMVALMPADHDMGDLLGDRSYPDRALIPASPWLSDGKPNKPAFQLVETRSGMTARMLDVSVTNASMWVVHTLSADEWKTELYPGSDRDIRLAETSVPLQAVAISAINRTGEEGPVSLVRIQPAEERRRAW